MNIRVHIERLILEGLPIDAEHGPAMQAALEAELTRILAERGLAPALQQGGATPYARAGSIRTARADTPAGIGTKIGAALGDLQP